MQERSVWARLACWLGLHRWLYLAYGRRVCLRDGCRRREVRDESSGWGTGWRREEEWE